MKGVRFRTTLYNTHIIVEAHSFGLGVFYDDVSGAVFTAVCR